LYGLAIGSGRYLPLNLPLMLLDPLAESVMDLEARIRYPQWTAGEKVVMLSAPVVNAHAQVVAMDRHIRQLEERLGRPTKGSIYWARGPLLGLEGRASFGHCMGSRPEGNPADADGLASVDRHEVAHCVLLSHCPAGFDPPALLTEGWAEANSGRDPIEVAKAAWERRGALDDLGLGELVGRDWYYCHESPVYVHGGPLVNFILSHYGPDRFVRLYTTCRCATFAADCERTLGVSLDQLDAAYRAEVENLATGGGALARLRRLELGAGVTSSEWNRFLAEAESAAARCRAAAEHVCLTVGRGDDRSTRGSESPAARFRLLVPGPSE
jgi:hypothetical protein